MHRLFVAIRPPALIRDQLLDLMEGVPGARWQDEDQLHLTLRFIGEVDAHTADDLHAALGAVRYPKFELELNGLGTFERRGSPAALWAGVAPLEPLKELHNKVDQACQRAGLAPERRAYAPHITLARLGPTTTGPIESLMKTSSALASLPFAVDSFCLFESDLTQAGAVHSMVERYSLI